MIALFYLVRVTQEGQLLTRRIDLFGFRLGGVWKYSRFMDAFIHKSELCVICRGFFEVNLQNVLSTAEVSDRDSRCAWDLNWIRISLRGDGVECVFYFE